VFGSPVVDHLPMNDLTIEEALGRVKEKAAMLRFMTEALAGGRVFPEPAAFHGMYDVCVDIETLVEKTCASLDVDTLSTELRRSRK
jgi:hypothetical protein